MQVILLQDVPNVGRKFEEAEVANGYGSNYLIPNGMAQVATDEIRLRYAKQKAAADADRQVEREELAAALGKIEGGSVTIKVANVGDQGQLFAGIYPKDIAAAINGEFGVGVAASDITQEHPISKVGEYEIEIKILEDVIPFSVIVEQGGSDSVADEEQEKESEDEEDTEEYDEDFEEEEEE